MAERKSAKCSYFGEVSRVRNLFTHNSTNKLHPLNSYMAWHELGGEKVRTI